MDGHPSDDHESPPIQYVAWYPADGCHLNLAGIYNYLETPYYLSQDYENSGKDIHPTCKEMLDAYIAPIFLENASKDGLKVPEFYISNGYFEPPVIIDPIASIHLSLKARLSGKGAGKRLLPGAPTGMANYPVSIGPGLVCRQKIPEYETAIGAVGNRHHGI